jgi:hypothetical protein
MTIARWFWLISCLAACHKGGGGPPDMSPWPQAYAVATTLMANAPQATSLIVAVPSLDASTQVDYGRAISIADTVSLFGDEGAGHFYATTAQTANVTRYDVDDHGAITPGPVLSFAGFGVSSTYSTRSIVLISPQKAYLLDDSTLQAITFDPTAMTLGSAIDLSAMKVTNYRTNFAYNILRRGTQILIAAFHYDGTYSHVLASTDLAIIDSATDTVTLAHDDRCGAFSTAAMLPSGDLYFGEDTYAIALHRLGGDAEAPSGCLLRIKAGQNVFDPDFFLRVSDVTGGQLGGAVVPGPEESLWVRAFDESLFSIDAATASVQILAAPAWRWWLFDPARPTTATKSTLPPGAGEVKWFLVGGHAFAGDGNQDYTMTAVVDLTSSAPTRGVVLRGHPSGIVKVR